MEAILNEILRANEWLSIVTPMVASEDKSYVGVIRVATPKGDLQIEIFVPPNFPLASAKFIATAIKGYQHQMYDQSLCLNTVPSTAIDTKFVLELEKLQQWIQRYYVDEIKEAHFEYHLFPNRNEKVFLFDEDENSPPVKWTTGFFSYDLLNETPMGQESIKTWIVHNIGGRSSRWSNTYQSIYQGRFKGLWVYLDKPPLIVGRQAVAEWKELTPFLSGLQERFIQKVTNHCKSESAFSDGFILMIGYKIPSGQTTETHWDPIFIRHDNFPFDLQKVMKDTFIAKDRGLSVDWCCSSNISYKRFFGRGKLSDALTENKILIIGTGAIGSSLFMALLRGGCRDITILDDDMIEPGNVCRGHFPLSDTSIVKTIYLLKEGLRTSPYVDIYNGRSVRVEVKGSDDYNQIQKNFNIFDYVFDCSTDKNLSVMLDGMNINGQIINLSISNEANHLAAITGVGNIHLIKSNLFSRIAPSNSEPFFVATGCFHPTFHASYVDISAPLMLALNEINSRLNQNIPIQSFFIAKTQAPGDPLSYKIDYHV